MKYGHYHCHHHHHGHHDHRWKAYRNVKCFFPVIKNNLFQDNSAKKISKYLLNIKVQVHYLLGQCKSFTGQAKRKEYENKTNIDMLSQKRICKNWISYIGGGVVLGKLVQLLCYAIWQYLLKVTICMYL